MSTSHGRPHYYHFIDANLGITRNWCRKPTQTHQYYQPDKYFFHIILLNFPVEIFRRSFLFAVKPHPNINLIKLRCLRPNHYRQKMVASAGQPFKSVNSPQASPASHGSPAASLSA